MLAFSISATRNSPISLQYYSEDSSLGVEYFQGSTFGYTVYGMLGMCFVALAVGLLWQYIHQTKFEKGKGNF